MRLAGRRWGLGEAWLCVMLKGQSGLHVPSAFYLSSLDQRVVIGPADHRIIPR